MSLTANATTDIYEEEHLGGVIRVLPDSLANKIAAGEVVQRPASVLKELMENSLDAGASQVDVIIRKAGSDLIQVTDNGCGMNAEDARACFGRHATSKINAIEDLDRLATLGFRGEALASIASVAQVELRTRRSSDEAGSQVRVDGGKLLEEMPVGAPAGTSIAVRNLFFNVPARRNFLKTPATEFKHIVETFQTQALSHPDCSFTLVHDEVEVYRLVAPGDLSDPTELLKRRIKDLYQKMDVDGLIRAEETTSYLSIDGFIGRPHDARKTKRDQFLFVNGRYVQNRSIAHAVSSAYGELLEDGQFPFMALFLSLDPRHVDVNVHPTKTEIKFDDDRGVYGFVKAVVKKALGTAGLSLPFDDRYATSITIPDRESTDSRLGVRMQDIRGDAVEALFQSTPSGLANRGPEIMGSETLSPSTFDIGIGQGSSSQSLRFPSRIVTQKSADQPTAATTERQIWQFHERYIMSPIRFGLMILDQQAAHERVLYEKALAALEGGLAGSQQLLFAATIDLIPEDFALVEELQEDLRSLGFDIELLSGRSVFVRGIPTEIQVGAEAAILEELLEQYRQNQDQYQINARENLARSIARKSSIKAGQALNQAEAAALIDQLFECRMPYADPLGRPTMVKISLEELARRFGRPSGR